MHTSLISIACGLLMIAWVIFPMGIPAYFGSDRKERALTWAKWKEEFLDSLKAASPYVIFWDLVEGYDRADDTVMRVMTLLGGLVGVGFGVYLICWGFSVWGM